MKKDLKIRYATECKSDRENFLDMHTSVCYLGYSVPREAVIKNTEDYLNNMKDIIFILFNEMIVGYAIISKLKRTFEILEFFIIPEFRRRHVGIIAVQKIKKIASDEGYQKIELISASYITDKFWERCGFKKGHIGVYVYELL